MICVAERNFSVQINYAYRLEFARNDLNSSLRNQDGNIKLTKYTKQ